MPVRLGFQELYVLTWFTFRISKCLCLVAVIFPAALLDVKPISLNSPPWETRPDGVVRGFRLNLRSTRAAGARTNSLVNGRVRMETNPAMALLTIASSAASQSPGGDL